MVDEGGSRYKIIEDRFEWGSVNVSESRSRYQCKADKDQNILKKPIGEP